MAPNDEFEYKPIFVKMLNQIESNLFGTITIKDRYDIVGNRMRLFLDSNKTNHYEICFRKDYLEIGLHFESTKAQNEARLLKMIENKGVIEKKIEFILNYGKLENLDYRRVWIEFPNLKITSDLISEYSKTTSLFILVTNPFLSDFSY